MWHSPGPGRGRRPFCLRNASKHVQGLRYNGTRTTFKRLTTAGAIKGNNSHEQLEVKTAAQLFCNCRGVQLDTSLPSKPKGALSGLQVATASQDSSGGETPGLWEGLCAPCCKPLGYGPVRSRSAELFYISNVPETLPRQLGQGSLAGRYFSDARL
jgi:hypothetical protein